MIEDQKSVSNVTAMWTFEVVVVVKTGKGEKERRILGGREIFKYSASDIFANDGTAIAIVLLCCQRICQ